MNILQKLSKATVLLSLDESNTMTDKGPGDMHSIRSKFH